MYPALLKEVNRISNARTKSAREDKNTKQRQCRLRDMLWNRIAIRKRHAQQPITLARLAQQRLLQPRLFRFDRQLRKHHFSSTNKKHIRFSRYALERHRPKSTPRRKRKSVKYLSTESSRRKKRAHGESCLRQIMRPVEIRPHIFEHSRFRQRAAQQKSLRRKTVFTQRPRLIHAEISDPTELFRRIHFLQKHMPPKEVRRTICKKKRHAKREPLRHDNACERPYMFHDTHARLMRHHTAHDRESNDNNQHIPGISNNRIDRLLYRALGNRRPLYSFGHTRDATLGKHGFHAHRTGTGRNNTPRKHAIPRAARQRCRLTRNQALVQLKRFRRQKHAVTWHLIAQPKQKYVSFPNIFRYHRFLLSVTHAPHMRRRQELEFFERAPGANILRKTERHIHHRHQSQKHSCLPIAKDKQKRHNRQNNAVRQEKYVSRNDIPQIPKLFRARC